MGTKTIPSYLSEEILKLTDKLIEAGVFSSRSEALRELAEAGTMNYEKLTRIANSIEELLKIEKKNRRRLR